MPYLRKEMSKAYISKVFEQTLPDIIPKVMPIIKSFISDIYEKLHFLGNPSSAMTQPSYAPETRRS